MALDQAELSRAVDAVVNDCLGVEAGEEVLVIANPRPSGSASAYVEPPARLEPTASSS